MKKAQTQAELVKLFNEASQALTGGMSDTKKELQKFQLNSETVKVLKDANSSLLEWFGTEFYTRLADLKSEGVSNKQALKVIFSDLESAVTVSNDDNKDYTRAVIGTFKHYYLECNATLKRELTTFATLKTLKKVKGFYTIASINALLTSKAIVTNDDYTKAVTGILNGAKSLQTAVKSINALSDNAQNTIKEAYDLKGQTGKMKLPENFLQNQKTVKAFIHAVNGAIYQGNLLHAQANLQEFTGDTAKEA